MELSKKKAAELAKTFTHVSKNTIIADARDYKTERGLLIYLRHLNEDNEKIHSQPMPVYIEIELEWHKGQYGWCPHASMKWCDTDGRWSCDHSAGYAGGCGYDKTSAAVAEALNKHCKNWLYSIRNRRTKNKPYGLSYYNGSFPIFEGGVGISCYKPVMEWLGWKFKHVASAKTYDKFIMFDKRYGKLFIDELF